MLTLTIEAEGRAPRTLTVERFPCRIGRRDDNEIVLDSWRVARRHAEIHRIERGVKVVDCGSIGGTWVNGERVVEYGPLSENDEIVLAGFSLRVGAVSRGGDPSPVADDDSGAEAAVVQTGGPRAPGAAGKSEPESLSLAWRRILHRRLLQTIDLRRKDVRQLTTPQLMAEARAALDALLAAEPNLPESVDRQRLIDEVLDEAIGLGPLQRLMAEPDVSEIMVNAVDDVWVERAGRLERREVSFTGDDAVRAIIDRIVAPVGRRVDESSPMVDARLPDGSRVNAVLPPLAIRGPAITIRRFNRRVLGPDDLIALGSASPEMVEFLRICVQTRRNVLISGGTGSGKTTLLNVLSNLVPAGERIVTIEDAAELRLRHSHLVALEARPANAEGRGGVAIRDLVRNALRMRPDRIIVGECRGGEALDMLQAMNTGHDGSLTTLHANSARDVVSRLETLVLMAGVDIPVTAIREQIASAVDVVVHQARLADGTRRITDIVEITGMEGVRVQMQPLFQYARSPEHRGGCFRPCDCVPQFYERLQDDGMALDVSLFRSDRGQSR